jgi:hypothetical protein
MSSLPSRITASGTGAIIELHRRTPSSEGRRLVTWRFHSSSLAERRSSFRIIPQSVERWSVIGIASAKWFHSIEVPWKLIQMAMSRGIHFRRVGEFRSTARAFAWPENASWAEIPLLSSQVREYSMHDELRVRDVSEPQGFPPIRVSKSASNGSSWLDVAQSWL